MVKTHKITLFCRCADGDEGYSGGEIEDLLDVIEQKKRGYAYTVIDVTESMGDEQEEK